MTVQRVTDRQNLQGSPVRPIYNRKSRYGGMGASDVKRHKELEGESRRLKQMYAELSLDH